MKLYWGKVYSEGKSVKSEKSGLSFPEKRQYMTVEERNGVYFLRKFCENKQLKRTIESYLIPEIESVFGIGLFAAKSTRWEKNSSMMKV